MSAKQSEAALVAIQRCACGHVAHAHFDLSSGQECAQCPCWLFRPDEQAEASSSE